MEQVQSEPHISSEKATTDPVLAEKSSHAPDAEANVMKVLFVGTVDKVAEAVDSTAAGL